MSLCSVRDADLNLSCYAGDHVGHIDAAETISRTGRGAEPDGVDGKTIHLQRHSGHGHVQAGQPALPRSVPSTVVTTSTFRGSVNWAAPLNTIPHRLR